MATLKRIAILSLACVAAACGERPGTDTAAADRAATAAATPQLTDAHIVALLQNTHQAEMSLAATARTTASAKSVKDYAARMIDEHTMMKRALDSLAAAKGITPVLPTGTEALQATIAGRADTLLKATGRSTDVAYIDGEAREHGRTIEALNRYAAAATDKDLRAFIRKMIPEVRLHQDRAIDIRRGL